MRRPLKTPLKFPLTTEEVCEYTGLSSRQLQWCAETNVVDPGRDFKKYHRGPQRAYSAFDVFLLTVYYELIRRGIRRPGAKRALRRLRAHFSSATGLGPAQWMVIDVKSNVFIYHTDFVLLESVKKSIACVVVDLDAHWKGMQKT